MEALVRKFSMYNTEKVKLVAKQVCAKTVNEKVAEEYCEGQRI